MSPNNHKGRSDVWGRHEQVLRRRGNDAKTVSPHEVSVSSILICMESPSNPIARNILAYLRVVAGSAWSVEIRQLYGVRHAPFFYTSTWIRGCSSSGQKPATVSWLDSGGGFHANECCVNMCCADGSSTPITVNSNIH
jgi:hypothetical protein